MAPQTPRRNRSPEGTHHRKRKRSPSPIQYKVEYREKKRKGGLLLIETKPWNYQAHNYTRVAYGQRILDECRRECIRRDLKAYALVSVDSRQLSIREVSTHDKRRGFLFPSHVVRDVERLLGPSTRPLDEEITAWEGTEFEILTLMKQEFPKLPTKTCQDILEHAWDPNHQNRVGFGRIALPLKIQAAVVAHIRHVFSNYETLLSRTNLYQIRWKDARESVTMTCIRKLHEFRGEAIESSLEQFEEVIDLTAPVTKRHKKTDTEGRPASAPNALMLSGRSDRSPSFPTTHYDLYGRPYVHGGANGPFNRQTNIQALARGASSSPNALGVLNSAHLTTVYDEDGNRPFNSVNENLRDTARTPLYRTSLDGSSLPPQPTRFMTRPLEQPMQTRSNLLTPPEVFTDTGLPLALPRLSNHRENFTPINSRPQQQIQSLNTNPSGGLQGHSEMPRYGFPKQPASSPPGLPEYWPSPPMGLPRYERTPPRRFQTPVPPPPVMPFLMRTADVTPPRQIVPPRRPTGADGYSVIDLTEDDEEDQPHVVFAPPRSILAPVPVSSKLRHVKLEDTVIESIEKD